LDRYTESTFSSTPGLGGAPRRLLTQRRFDTATQNILETTVVLLGPWYLRHLIWEAIEINRIRNAVIVNYNILPLRNPGRKNAGENVVFSLGVASVLETT
jgi:hypothetical protein